jgi:hypothetical protein
MTSYFPSMTVVPSLPLTIFLCQDENTANDSQIRISPISNKEVQITYREPETLFKRWNCDAAGLLNYIRVFFDSLMADNGTDQVKKIQISAPLFPSFMMPTFISPKNIEKIRDLVLAQLSMFIVPGADGSAEIRWPQNIGGRDITSLRTTIYNHNL